MAEPASKKPKLTYFACRGRAELTRLVFATGKVDYENERVPRAEQKRRKEAGELPFGQFPTLTVGDQCYAQSYSIAKYAAKIAGLHPTDPLLALAAESIVDTTDDVRSKYVPIRYAPVEPEGKLEKYKEFFTNILPSLLANFERLFDKAGDKGFLVGNTLSVADLAVFNMCDYLTFPSCEVQAGSEEHKQMGATCLDAFPKLLAHKSMVAAIPEVAAWHGQRPQQPHDNIITLEA
eukprot:gnl/MRDRNA2_/MRDRNA2_83830_c0_seq2.p1 gnl/MRDRNA2_/MRDRNA2_83830_c0~~gnl/MRDRNA2_/MRDRNA2_83830_c0_seq2.p1  ORF type:complete len:263 (-),score=40.36 gnl/MRDRNA2_/MRDRNA2_83830_c0_seq2:45-749(-)